MNCRKYLQATIVSTFNMTVVTVVHQAAMWYLAKWRIKFGYDELPSLPTAVSHIIIFLVVVEITFFYMHR